MEIGLERDGETGTGLGGITFSHLVLFHSRVIIKRF